MWSEHVLATLICSQLLYVTIVANSVIPFELICNNFMSWKLIGPLKWGSLGLKTGSANLCTIIRYDRATNKIELIYELYVESS